MEERLYPLLPEEGRLQDHRRYIILIAIAAKVYNALLLKRVRPEVEKILRIIRSVFGEINQQPFRF